MNKFFYRIILLIPLFFSQISFSLSFKYNTGENLVERIREKNTQEKRIKLVLDSIRKHNNKIVRFYLATKDNIINRQNLEDSILHRKEGVYGVNLDKKSIYEGDIELVDINAKSQDGYTPIVVAIEAKNHEILNLLNMRYLNGE